MSAYAWKSIIFTRNDSIQYIRSFSSTMHFAIKTTINPALFRKGRTHQRVIKRIRTRISTAEVLYRPCTYVRMSKRSTVNPSGNPQRFSLCRNLLYPAVRKTINSVYFNLLAGLGFILVYCNTIFEIRTASLALNYSDFKKLFMKISININDFIQSSN